MMSNEKISEKIREIIKSSSSNQLKTIDLMVNIRKLLEINDQKSEYPTLRLYCDWTLHTKMTGTETKKLLEEIKNEICSSGSFMKSQSAMNFITFVGLQMNLLHFLEKNSIDNNFGDEKEWNNFIRYLSIELIDSPLIFESTSFVIIDVTQDSINYIYIGEDGLSMNAGFYIQQN